MLIAIITLRLSTSELVTVDEINDTVLGVDVPVPILLEHAVSIRMSKSVA